MYNKVLNHIHRTFVWPEEKIKYICKPYYQVFHQYNEDVLKLLNILQMIKMNEDCIYWGVKDIKGMIVLFITIQTSTMMTYTIGFTKFQMHHKTSWSKHAYSGTNMMGLDTVIDISKLDVGR